jgi:hypothetical protein
MVAMGMTDHDLIDFVEHLALLTQGMYGGRAAVDQHGLLLQLEQETGVIPTTAAKRITAADDVKSWRLHS